MGCGHLFETASNRSRLWIRPPSRAMHFDGSIYKRAAAALKAPSAHTEVKDFELSSFKLSAARETCNICALHKEPDDQLSHNCSRLQHIKLY
eukprot:4655074-Amphidinium_carterae.1